MLFKNVVIRGLKRREGLFSKIIFNKNHLNVFLSVTAISRSGSTSPQLSLQTLTRMTISSISC